LRLVALSIDDHDFAEVAQRRSATASAVKYDAAHSRLAAHDGPWTVRLRLPALVGPESDPAVRAVTKRLALGTAATA
jgi:hypothetical protein